MGLRQHNQTRKPRILSQAQLSQTSSNGGGNAIGGSNWFRMNSIQNNTFSQPNSEFSLNYDGGEQTEKLSKASSTCEDRVRQSHSGALSDGTSSVPQSCHSGGDNTSGDEPEPQWVRHCVNRCLSVNSSNGGGISPNLAIAQTLLSGLAGAAPYPRLADIARCALLACEQRDTLCARQEAELTVLEASLAESKATGDQLHCRLGQIESSWGSASRAADLADMALETSGILVHLYSSELALLLHKQPSHDKSSSSKSHHHHQRPFGRPGTFSSSTSTSSSSSSCTSSSGDEDEDECVHPRPPCKPPVPAHMVTPNNRSGPMNNGDVGRHAQIPPGTTISDNGSNVYAVYAPNGKPSEEMGSHIPMPTWIPPHAVCNGPACLRLLKMQRHQTEVAALQLLARFASTPEPFFKPESLISAAPGEDFEPNGTNGNRSTATCTESGLGVESGGSSSGMGAHGVYANAWCIASRPVAPLRQAFKSGGGWQTPDSGAGSFSTNDHAGNAATASAVSGVSTTHSSNSSASSAPPNMGVGVNQTTSVASDGAGWSRMKEMKLRHILDQIIWERMLVRSTIAVGGNDFESASSGVPPNGEFHYMKPYAGSEMLTYGDSENLAKDSREPVVFSRLNTLMMLDTAALLQDLCAVKEDRAKLKVQNYIMEKELRAIQISHQGHCLSESALRNQLNALQIDRNLHMLKNSDRNGTQNLLAQQIENLQSAFESLRKGTEQHQSQSEELVNDLKQANAALITAFEKAKSKYLARIRKLEGNSLSRANSSAMPPSNITSNAEKHACSAGRPPAVPAHRNSQPPPPLPPLSPAPPSDVYEVIQDTHVGPPSSWQDSPVVSGSGRSEPPMANGCYSLVRTAPFYPKSHSMMVDNRSHARPR
ncbi:unnamed protein product [Hymenolepis diminuta]|uniref:Harmonin-binding protein USHBP1 PDZ-binding domain-containing protein n=1 Tax=Hymenolepis diminuta TaxID=6216 RepID=A0A564ZBD1_HYMDI|nr:unnamed protein product [Hymenolepis diminuta]